MEIELKQLIEAYSRIAHVSHYHIFIIVIALDIVSGYVKAIVKKDLDSNVGLKGILKHLSVAGLVFLICPYLYLLGYQNIAIFLIDSIILTYAISIVENYDQISPGTLPKGLSNFLRRTKEDLDNKEIDIK